MAEAKSFEEALLLAANEAQRATIAAWPERPIRLTAIWEEALRENPGLVLSCEVFARFVAERLDRAGDLAAMEDFFEHLHAGDLFLACACIQGDARAYTKFEARFGAEARAIARRFVGDGLEPDELVQALRLKVLVGSEGKPPKLVDYDGQGFLQNWMRITTLRAFIDLQRSARAKGQREAAESLSEAVGSAGDLELDFFKREYRESFRAAFGRAVRGLESKDRALLRHHAVAQLTIDQIAAIYHVHRATAARRLEGARKRLLALVREELKAKLRIADDELDSMIELVQSQLDVSFRRLFDSLDSSEDPG